MVTSRKCLSLSFGIATEKQVLLIIDDLISQGENILGTKLVYDILFHTKLGGKTYGNGYLWIEDDRFYPLLNKTVEIGSYELSPRQISMLEKSYLGNIPHYGTIIINKAKYVIENIDNDIYHMNIISAIDIPSWITIEDMDIMKKFSSSKFYPLIDISGSKVTITFDPKTNDGIFALLMNQGREFIKENHSTKLFFNRELKRYGLFELKNYGSITKKIIEDQLIDVYTGNNYLQHEALRIL